MESLHFSRHPLYLKYVSAVIFAQNQLEISLPHPPMQWLKAGIHGFQSQSRYVFFGMQNIDLNSSRFFYFYFFGMCSFSGKLWSIFKICVRDSSGKASKIMEIRIPTQITNNFKSSLYVFLVLLYSAFIRQSFCSISGLLYLESAHYNKEL